MLQGHILKKQYDRLANKIYTSLFYGRVEPKCTRWLQKLVNGPSPTSDSNITASYELKYDHGPHRTGAWCPAEHETQAETLNMFIQVSIFEMFIYCSNPYAPMMININ